MRDRLIKIINDFYETESAIGLVLYFTEEESELIADYLLENGVIVPPCKAGDKLYQIVDMSHTACKSFVSNFPIRVEPYQIYYINIMGGVSAMPFENFGKTVFLTKEEAEAKLKERNNETK